MNTITAGFTIHTLRHTRLSSFGRVWLYAITKFLDKEDRISTGRKIGAISEEE